jgi:GTPase SAR1 family protein
MAKIVFMGLAASGKSSIKSVVFEGKSPDTVKDYKATLNYSRSTKNIVSSDFNIFDCGGQESFMDLFTGSQAEFIFSDVSMLVYVIDASNFQQINASKYYFDKAMALLGKFSPQALTFCLLHKIDLVDPEKVDNVIEILKKHFKTDTDSEVRYRGTSILNESIFLTVGEIIQELMLKETKGKSISEAIQHFISENRELSGIAIYNEDGLPLFEEGEDTEKIILPANLWLTHSARINEQLGEHKSVLETNEYIFVFQKFDQEHLLSGIAKKVAPLQYVKVKMDNLADIMSRLL